MSTEDVPLYNADQETVNILDARAIRSLIVAAIADKVTDAMLEEVQADLVARIATAQERANNAHSAASNAEGIATSALTTANATEAALAGKSDASALTAETIRAQNAEAHLTTALIQTEARVLSLEEDKADRDELPTVSNLATVVDLNAEIDRATDEEERLANSIGDALADLSDVQGSVSSLATRIATAETQLTQTISVATADSRYQPRGDYLTEERDPTVPAWAKQPNPPTVTPSGIGAAPTSHTHLIGQVEGLQSTLDGKASASTLSTLQADVSLVADRSATNEANISALRAQLSALDGSVSDLSERTEATATALDSKADKTTTQADISALRSQVSSLNTQVATKGDLTTSVADSKYQPKGDYATQADVTGAQRAAELAAQDAALLRGEFLEAERNVNAVMEAYRYRTQEYWTGNPTDTGLSNRDNWHAVILPQGYGDAIKLSWSDTFTLAFTFTDSNGNVNHTLTFPTETGTLALTKQLNIVKSPDGSSWRIKVSNTGTLTAEKVTA